MDDASEEERISAFVQGNLSSPLKSSSRHNVPVHRVKDLQIAANDYICRALSGNETFNDSKSSNSIYLERLSNSFKCLYMIPAQDEIEIVKKHQLFVIKLIECKQLTSALQELHILLQVLNRVVYSVKASWNSKYGVETISGLSYVESVFNPDHTIHIIGLIVGFHFLLLQSLLLHVSSNIKVLLTNSDHFINFSLLERITGVFEKESNFMKWLVLSNKKVEANRAKYRKNVLKMLKGFIKVIDIIQNNKRTSKLREHKHALQQKLAEFSDDVKWNQLNADEHTVNNISTTSYMEMPALKKTCYGLTAVTRPHPSALEAVNNCLERFMSAPSLDNVRELELALLGSPAEVLTNDDILGLLSSYKLQNDSISRILSKAVMVIFCSKSGKLSSLRKSHILLLDNLTIYIKGIIDTTDDIEFPIEMISDIYSFLSLFQQYKRIKNLSNMMFALGYKWQNIECWRCSLEYELFIVANQQSMEKLNDMQVKASKIANTLFGIRNTSTASQLLMRALKAIDARFKDAFKDVSLNQSFLQVVAKCFSCDQEFMCSLLAGQEISDSFKYRLVLDLFQTLEKSTDMSKKTTIVNRMMKFMRFQDNEMEKNVIYSYYNINGLTDMLDFQPSVPINGLLLCGLHLQRLINFDFDSSLLESCVKSFEEWAENSTPLEEGDSNIIKSFLQYLRFNGFTGHVIRLITTLRKSHGDFENEMEVFLESELCQSILYLSITNDVSESLAHLNTFLKKSETNSILKIVSFNLLSLEYCISIGNASMATEQFNKIRNVLSSREEFQITTSESLSIIDKFNNLLFVAKFQKAASKLNLLLNNPSDAYENLRITIKLLYSIIKKCAPNMPKEQYNKIKWETTHLLFEAYKSVMILLKEMGITRHVLFYMNELKKVNTSTVTPLINCINYFELLLFSILLKKSEDYSTFLKAAEGFCKQQLIASNVTIRFLKCKVDSWLFGVSEEVQLPRFCSIKDIPHFDLDTFHKLDYSQESSLEYLISLTKKKYDLSAEFISKHDNITMTLLECRAKLSCITRSMRSHPRYSQILRASHTLPSITSEGLVNSTIDSPDLLNELLRCKDSLRNCLFQQEFASISIHKLKDVNFLLSRCLLLVSSLATCHSSNNILTEFFYLQDLCKSLPFANDKLLSRKSSTSKDLLPLPLEVGKFDFQARSVNFNIDLALHFPKTWTLVTIDICHYTGDILLSKYVNGKQPWFIRLPLSRHAHLNEKITSMSFEDMENEFKDIISKSDLSTKASTTSVIHTKEDRKNWWRLRFGLDLRMKDLLDHISLFWFGGFKGLFHNFEEDSVYQKFKVDVMKLLNNTLPSRKSLQAQFMQFDDNVIKTLYSLPKFELPAVNDLVHYMIDTLQLHGEDNEYEEINFEKFNKSLEILFDKYFSLRSAFAKEHIVLVPSSKCAFFPWESLSILKGKSVSRAPSIDHLLELLKKDQKRAVNGKSNLYYLINPGGDLVRTENRFKPLFQSQEWNGLVGNKPTEEELLENILSSDLFVYLGHGGCEQYIRASTLYKTCLPDGPTLPPSLLIGCSSGALQESGILEPHGNIYNWLTCGTPSVLVNLWDVTDKDIDLFSMSVFEKWGMLNTSDSTMSICEAVGMSRETCTLNYLNGSAPIVYGLPLRY
ncbi:separin protein [Scheffersomyces xylosifermentans]|uniref:separin protein n=1 Tax=Scheffersomyces xylosifermentans TaxID=1304137 RepID=UPI00315D16B7